MSSLSKAKAGPGILGSGAAEGGDPYQLLPWNLTCWYTPVCSVKSEAMCNIDTKLADVMQELGLSNDSIKRLFCVDKDTLGRYFPAVPWPCAENWESDIEIIAFRLAAETGHKHKLEYWISVFNNLQDSRGSGGNINIDEVKRMAGLMAGLAE
jgi:hypothetical protein